MSVASRSQRNLKGVISLITLKDLRLRGKHYVLIQWEHWSQTACVAKAFQISAGGAGRIDVEHKFCSLLKHVRLAVGRLHDDGFEDCLILSVREK